MNPNPNATTVLCYGDSNTYGTRATEWSRYPADIRWTGQLQSLLGMDYYIVEQGLAGRTVDIPDGDGNINLNGRDLLPVCLDSHSPLDIVVVMLGTNDLKQQFGRSASQIADSLGRLADLIKAKTARDAGRAAEIVLISPIHVNDLVAGFYEDPGQSFDQNSVIKSHQLADEIARVAKATQSHFLDAALISSPGVDGIHLDEQSHTALAHSLADAIRQIQRSD